VPNGTGSFLIQSSTFNGNNSPLSVIDNNLQNEELTIYPNPSSMVINVAIPNLMENEKIEIYNQLGQLVAKSEASNVTTVDISNLPSGTYLLNYGNTTKKIIVFK
jgi:hypothetical protein